MLTGSIHCSPDRPIDQRRRTWLIVDVGVSFAQEENLPGIELPATLADELEQTPTRVVVLLVGLEDAILSYLSHQGSIALPLLAMVRVDATALEWTLLIGVAAALLFGAAPGFR